MSTIRAFMFHDVRDASNTKYASRYSLKSYLTPEIFKRQIEFISSRYKVIDSSEILSINLDGDENYAVLTFDDGLKDHLNVAKYLKDNSLPATFFVPVEPVFHNTVIHAHKIQFILSVTNEKELVKEILNNFSDEREVIWNQYSQTIWKDNWWTLEMIFITNFLRKHNTEKFNCYDYCDVLFNKYVVSKDIEYFKNFYLNEQDLSYIYDNGFTIGGHGYSSNNLLLEKEWIKDIKKCEPIKSYTDFLCFSYPHGGYSDEIKKELKQNGYEFAYTVNPFTITELDKFDSMEFPRYDAPQRILV